MTRRSGIVYRLLHARPTGCNGAPTVTTLAAAHIHPCVIASPPTVWLAKELDPASP